MPVGTLADILNAAVADQRRISDDRTTADAAIRRLATLNGPQAGAWMETLNQSPGRALRAAEKFGGISAVEQALRGAQGLGEAVKSGQIASWESDVLRGDPAAYGAMMQGRGLQAGAEQARATAELRGAEAARTRAQANVLSGAGGLPGGVDATDPNLPLKLALAGMTAESGSVREAQSALRSIRKDDRQRGLFGDIDLGHIDSRLSKWEQQMAPYQDIGLVRRQIESADDTTLGAITLVNRLQQQIDPGAVVREGDVKLITGGVLAGADQTWADLVKWINKDAGANLVVPQLKAVLSRMMDDKEDEYASKAEDMLSYMDRNKWTQAARLRGGAYLEEGLRAIEARNAREQERSKPVVSRSQYDIARKALVDQGLSPDQITPSLIADMIEMAEAEGEQPAATAPPSSGPRPVTPAELEALARAGRL